MSDEDEAGKHYADLAAQAEHEAQMQAEVDEAEARAAGSSDDKPRGLPLTDEEIANCLEETYWSQRERIIATIKADRERIAEYHAALEAAIHEKCAVCNVEMGTNICHDCRHKVEDCAKRIALLEGAAKADENRLIEASKRADVTFFGCDTPEHLADEIETLRARIAALAADNARTFNAAEDVWAKRELVLREKIAELEKCGDRLARFDQGQDWYDAAREWRSMRRQGGRDAV